MKDADTANDDAGRPDQGESGEAPHAPMPCGCGGRALHLETPGTARHAFCCSSPKCPKVTEWHDLRGQAEEEWEVLGRTAAH